MEIEIWKPLIGYEGLYEISNYSIVKRISRKIKSSRKYRLLKEKTLTLSVDKGGYLFVFLSKNGKETSRASHRLMMETFRPVDDTKLQVNHKDGNKKNNFIDNLEWVTASENVRHSFRELGRIAPRVMGRYGRLNGASKSVICVSTNKQYESVHIAAVELGIDFRNISAVCLGKRKSAGGHTFKYTN